jgi:pimeloyl-ACP methyl ester carboxylesterase
MGACLPPVIINEIARDWATVDPRVPLQAADGHLSEGFDHAASLAAVRCPVLLWEADRDLCGIVPPTGFERLKGCLSHVPHRHVYAAGAGHQIHRDAPQFFATQTTDFFRLIEPAGHRWSGNRDITAPMRGKNNDD